jgi:CubicO group peptidase (beta-lactamase class C family)
MSAPVARLTGMRSCLEPLIGAAVSSRAIPGVAIAVGSSAPGEAVFITDGVDNLNGHGHPISETTMFDLASLTKVIITLPAVLELVARGALGLDDPVSLHLPEFDGGRGDITVRHLLAHTSGLRASARYYLSLDDAAQVRAAVLAETPQTPPGSSTTYSDLGYMVLGFLVETVTATPLQSAAQELVLRPMGLVSATFRPRHTDDVRFAATEILDGKAVIGIVHDRNARVLGGVAGHAGLFGTVGDLARCAMIWADRGASWPRADLRAEALRRQTPAPGAARGLGWVLNAGAPTFMTPAWPKWAAGHTGFTGTSIAFDPRTGLWVAFLTNALHAGRNKTAIVRLRQDVHAMVASFMDTASEAQER